MADDTVLVDWEPGTRNYRIRVWVVAGVGVVYTLFVAATLVLFVLRARNRHSGLQKHSVLLVLIQAAGCYLVGVDGLVTAALNNWACFGKLWLFNMGFVMSLGAILARAFRLLVVYRVHELSSKLSYSNNSPVPAADGAARANCFWQPYALPDEAAARMSSEVLAVRITAAAAGEPAGHKRWSFAHGGLTVMHPRKDDLYQLRKYRRLLPYVSDRMLVMFISAAMVAAAVLSLVVNATDHQFAMRPVNTVCSFIWGFLPITAIISVCFFIVFPLFLWRLRNHRDAYGIRHDLIICDTVGIGVLALTLVWVQVLHETQQIWPGLSYIWLYAILIHISSVFVPLVRAYRHSKSTAAADAAAAAAAAGNFAPSSAQPHSTATDRQAATASAPVAAPSHPLRRQAAFTAALDNPTEYQRIRAFAVSCLCTELTAFLEKYQALKAETLALSLSAKKVQDMPTTSIMLSIVDAMAAAAPALGTSTRSMQFPRELADTIKSVYWDFVDPSSYSSLNASPTVARHIKSKIDSNDLPITLLDELRDEVLAMLYTDVYTRYIRRQQI
ncbi:hypothetical protein H4R18_000253 [Coemansia javaensis]|uniref:G-protein coupled receptors family 3 profile domain-containing protein n=1 Tax=Coemansia javaensis TaxID=2761396 RepID=A0A9W8HK80_9FUNG|nr:hypothetical protein H4R18_000253 [Coemansia javaensis]